jgi:hypothetical protein
MGRKKGGKNRIPLSEKSRKKVEKGLQEAKEGKIEKVNLPELLKEEHKEELTKEQKERKEKLKDVMRDINKSMGDSTMMKFGSEEPPKESINFGNIFHSVVIQCFCKYKGNF